ncbi:hypothetical protein SDC9_166884 [bioreactor metagenome]|uniref:Uncharacterized protein n=1 Tax=bioreactor metagenome TaxID=1076179 RepID=A0A645G6F5_9ZZZZ
MFVTKSNIFSKKGKIPIAKIPETRADIPVVKDFFAISSILLLRKYPIIAVNTIFTIAIKRAEYIISFLCWTFFKIIGTVITFINAIRVISIENLPKKAINITFNALITIATLSSIRMLSSIGIQEKGIIYGDIIPKVLPKITVNKVKKLIKINLLWSK